MDVDMNDEAGPALRDGLQMLATGERAAAIFAALYNFVLAAFNAIILCLLQATVIVCVRSSQLARHILFSFDFSHILHLLGDMCRLIAICYVGLYVCRIFGVGTSIIAYVLSAVWKLNGILLILVLLLSDLIYIRNTAARAVQRAVRL